MRKSDWNDIDNRRITVNSGAASSYDIVYSDSFGSLYAELEKAAGDRGIWKKALIVTDSNVAPLYLEAVTEALSGREIAVSSVVLPAGEENKTLDTVRLIYHALIGGKFDRRSLIVALGGGVVGDMAGFAAATYMRGIDYIQVPTTLLAQADSSIGGKTGVDLDGYKNMVGAFLMPRLVYINLSTLDTLPGREFACGFAEVMKHGLIRDSAFYVWLIDNLYEIGDREIPVLYTMLKNSCLIKKSVVESDPLEKGERMLLNFGHTIGHAIEKYKNFTMSHGECVALGCIAAAYISWKKDILSMEEYYEIRDMFVPFGLPISVEDVDPDEITALTRSDKKARNGALNFVLLRSVGDAYIDTRVTDEEITAAVKEILYVEDGE